MKRFVFCDYAGVSNCGICHRNVSAAGPRPTQPVIVAEMPDC